MTTPKATATEEKPVTLTMTTPIVAPPPTAGFKTSEFWLTIVVALAALAEQFAGSIPEPWGTVCAAVASVGYALSRGLTKKAP